MHITSFTEAAPFAHPRAHIEEIGIQPGMYVADFGSGSGMHALELAHATGPDGRVYAIDVQRDLLTRLKNEARRRELHHVDVFWGDLEVPGGSKLTDDHVDVALIANVLSLAEDKLGLLREARRILKHGGRVAVIERTEEAGLHPHSLMSREELLGFARMAELEPLREFEAGSHHWGILLRPTGGIMS